MNLPDLYTYKMTIILLGYGTSFFVPFTLWRVKRNTQPHSSESRKKVATYSLIVSPFVQTKEAPTLPACRIVHTHTHFSAALVRRKKIAGKKCAIHSMSDVGCISCDASPILHLLSLTRSRLGRRPAAVHGGGCGEEEVQKAKEASSSPPSHDRL